MGWGLVRGSKGRVLAHRWGLFCTHQLMQQLLPLQEVWGLVC